MTSTRRAPPVEIYHDPAPHYDDLYSAELDPESQALLQALRPITNPTTKSHYPVLDPHPFSGGNYASPRKSTSQLSSPIIGDYAALTSISIPPPQQMYQFTDSLPKKPTTTTIHMPPVAKPQKVLFTTFPPPRTADKENLYHPALGNDHVTQFSDPGCDYKGPCKRPAIDAVSLRDMPKSKKIRQEDDTLFILPEPNQMPHVEDEGGKPPYSYATLIGMAILRAPNRRLTLAQIYKWISDTFLHYRAADSGWQNSIRHNLSLNKAFVKQERPKDDPGKGNYWAIQLGAERQFVKDKPVRRVTNPDSAYFHTMHYDAARPSTAPCTTMFSFHPLSSTNIDSSRFPEDPEPSSDGTIPASDPAAPADDLDDLGMPPPSSRLIRSSPPPAHIRSSPPIARQYQHEGTPPPIPCFPSTSRSGGRKRRLGPMQDSGYFSSIESSALRGSSTFINNPMNLSSEVDLDRPSMKPGRAEEEIARMRGSSHDPIPTKTKASIKQPTIQLPPSSPLRTSPLRNETRIGNDSLRKKSVGMPPLTPGVVFKKPAKPPASASPNTNLRNHRNRIRDLIGSPGQGLGMLGDDLELGWSPAFKFETPEDEPAEHTPDVNFLTVPNGLFAMNSFNADVLAERGSPEKKSAKRPRLERASTTANVLSDITGLSNNKLGTPFKFAKPVTGMDTRSPAKRVYDENRPMKLPTLGDTPAWDGKELFGDLWSDGTDENAGMDILQGFKKIGEETFESSTKGLVPTRPMLGRSLTSMF